MTARPSPPGNVHRPFEELMRLEKINNVTFRSIAPPFSPGDTEGRAYGGHVYAQAAWAAAQTLPPGFVLHHVTGNFLLPGLVSVPFVYKVHPIRDGKGYCTRIVNVTQSEGKGVCFTCTCSFKKAEDGPVDVQARIDLRQTYDVALRDRRPEDFPPPPDVPQNWSKDYVYQFPGLEMRKPNMEAYNSALNPLQRRHLLFYRVIGALPPDANLSLCAHLYASDRNSLFIIAHHFDLPDVITLLGSLVHSVTFHAPVRDLMMLYDDGRAGDAARKWFCKEDWTTRMVDNRGMFHSRACSPDGAHIATIAQDGMMRQPRDVPRMREMKQRL